MRTLLILGALFCCTLALRGDELVELPQHAAMAQQYAVQTGQTYELCLQALKVGTWCRAHPQGGVVSGKTYDAVGTAEMMLDVTRFLNTKATPASNAQQPAPSADEQRQSRLAQKYAASLGKSYDVCLKAVVTCDWCKRHPQGSVVNGVTYDAAATLDQFDAAMAVLGMPLPAPVAVVRPVAAAGVGRVLESSIDGEFEGFEGDKVFKLLNGQVWQQMDFYYHYHYAYGPHVMIYQGNGGTMMKVDGVEKAVRVMQLR